MARKEAARIVLHGQSEFEASHVVLEGNQNFEVRPCALDLCLKRLSDLAEECKALLLSQGANLTWHLPVPLSLACKSCLQYPKRAMIAD